MNPRDIILAAVRRNLPQPAVPLPADPETDQKKTISGLGYKEHLASLPEVPRFSHLGEPILTYFRRELEAMGGRSFEVSDVAAAQAKVAELFPTAKVVCSAVPEVPGTKRIEAASDPHELNDVDVGVVRSPIGVAEAASGMVDRSGAARERPWGFVAASCRAARSRSDRRDHARRL